MNDKENLKRLPGIDRILNYPKIADCVHKHGHELVVYASRRIVNNARDLLKKGKSAPSEDNIVRDIINLVESVYSPSLKYVVNATGIILHTNLGRAPLGRAVLDAIEPVAAGYSNLEFDLKKGSRGQRNTHVSELLRYLTGAEDAVVVNNNAAGIMLTLNTLARRKEVIISRGELIEIGGAFRIPEILKASGARMVEVGTTNKTKISDYRNAVSPKTALILKAHKSNFAIKGFTEEVSIKDLAAFAHSCNLPFVYDIGSGLLRRPEGIDIEDEPDVQSAIKDGADIVAFSGDKLLGGPQAGIVAGKKDLVVRLAKAPMMRALRVGKLTIAALSAACRNYLNEDSLKNRNPMFGMFERTAEQLDNMAAEIRIRLEKLGVESVIIESDGRCGGGTLPELAVKSKAVSLNLPGENKKKKSARAKKVFKKLLDMDPPVLGILREGKIVFDVLTIFERDIQYIAEAVKKAVYG